MDRELRQQLNEINTKLDKLTSGETTAQKSKTPTLKRIAIAVPIVVAVIGLIGTAYELGLQFLENQSNRKTIDFYTQLSRSLVENGDYQSAKIYLNRAEDIDANNAEVISTKAFIDMLDLIRSSIIENQEALSTGTYYLNQLHLNPEEIHYHLGLVAAQEGKFEDAEKYLQWIEDRPERYSLLARTKLINQVYQRSLNLGEKGLKRTVTEIVNDTERTLASLIHDVQEFTGDSNLTENLTNQIYAFGWALVFRLSTEQLIAFRDLYSQLNPPDSVFMHTLNNHLALIVQGAEYAYQKEEQVLQDLYRAREKSAANSPVSRQLNDTIMQYSARVQIEETETNESAGHLENLRLQGLKKRQTGDFESAHEIFQKIVREYQTNNLGEDKTLYKTYFTLALLNEYYFNNIDQAIAYYNLAASLDSTLQLHDPSIHNTLGYLYFKLGRDAYHPQDKLKFLNLADEKLSKALAIDPKYSKSLKTLELVRAEFNKLDNMQMAQQQRIAKPIRRLQADKN